MPCGQKCLTSPSARTPATQGPVMSSVSDKSMKNPKEIVRDGYDKVSFAYRANEPDKSDERYQQYEQWVNEISSYLAEDCSVLDLGCGCGLPSTKWLSDRFRVTGVDISPV